MFSSRYVEKNSTKRKDGLQGLIMVFQQETFKFQTEIKSRRHYWNSKSAYNKSFNRYPSYSQSCARAKFGSIEFEIILKGLNCCNDRVLLISIKIWRTEKCSPRNLLSRVSKVAGGCRETLVGLDVHYTF